MKTTTTNYLAKHRSILCAPFLFLLDNNDLSDLSTVCKKSILVMFVGDTTVINAKSDKNLTQMDVEIVLNWFSANK